MRKIFIIVTLGRYLFKVGVSVYSLFLSPHISYKDTHDCKMNSVSFMSFIVDIVAFVHNLIVFTILIYLLKNYHYREYKLKRKGLYLYFSILYLNFVTYTMIQTFMNFCVDYQIHTKNGLEPCTNNIHNCNTLLLSEG